MRRSSAAIPRSLLTDIGLSPQGRAYRAYPDLKSARWLLPADRPSVARAGIDGLFNPSSLKGKALKRLISLRAIPGTRVFLEERSLKELEERLAGVLGRSEVHIAFYIGVPGAYQKVTAQVMDAEGETLAFIKIATSAQTISDVEAEHSVLSRLSESEPLKGKVPEALSYFDWREGRVLAMTAGPPDKSPQELTDAHREFCRDAFLSFAKKETFARSPMMRRMTETSQRLAPDLPDQLASDYAHAIRLLGDELGSVRLPLSVAHRDFAPWNIRQGERGLFVFDWDRAEEGSTPLYDAFHFQAIQAILLSRREHLPDAELLDGMLGDVWPEGREHLPWLYLAYLVDMSLFYSEARVTAPEAGEQEVWRWFAERISDFLRRGSPIRPGGS